MGVLDGWMGWAMASLYVSILDWMDGWHSGRRGDVIIVVGDS